MSDQELKPCPFCGKEASVYVFDATGTYDRNIKYEYQPGCETDGCPGEWGLSSYSSGAEARKQWNRRTPDPILEEVAGWLRDRGSELYNKSKRLDNEFGQRDAILKRAECWFDRATQVEAMTIIKTCETCINFDEQFNDCLSSFDSSFENGADIEHCGTKFCCIHYEDKQIKEAK